MVTSCYEFSNFTFVNLIPLLISDAIRLTLKSSEVLLTEQACKEHITHALFSPSTFKTKKVNLWNSVTKPKVTSEQVPCLILKDPTIKYFIIKIALVTVRSWRSGFSDYTIY